MDDYIADEPIIEEITMTEEEYDNDLKKIEKPDWESYRKDKYYICDWCGWEGHLGTIQTSCPEDDCWGKLQPFPFKERFKRDMKIYEDELEDYKEVSKFFKIED